MASISRPTRPTEARSGGKMVRPRRTFAAKTPYDRPGLSPNSNPQIPNWLSRYVYSPTRSIATGAGKIISSVFNTDPSPSSSSGSDLEDDSDDDSDDIDNSPHAADTTKKDETVEVIQHPSELQSIVQKSEPKHLIEQLIMQVTFSSEEFDRLTNIIKSRVVDGPIIGDAGDGGSREPSRTVGNDADMPDLCIAAVMEAKKWLEEKKLGSNSKSELELGICTLKSAMLPHGTKGEAGSPVDMAKSYMRTRPPWASPSVSWTEYRSPSPTGMQLFKDGMPYSIGFSSFSSKMKRDSPASGSWNITEEIRKVRSKATKEMLRTPSKVDWSALALEHKSAYNSLVANEVEASMRDELPSFTKSIDASLNLVSGGTTSCDFAVSQAAQDGLQSEAPLPNPPALISEQNQLTIKDLEDIWTMEENRVRLSCGQRLPPAEELQSDVDGLKDTNGNSELFNNKMDGTLQDPGFHDQNGSMPKETIWKGGSFAANGSPASVSSLSPGEDIEQNSRLSDEKQNMVGSGHDEVSPSVPTGETCALLNEASVEVPIMCENDSVAIGSENSSSVHDEGLGQATPNSNSKRSVTGKTSGATEKQQGKKISRYSRKGRGRGK